MSVQGSSNTYAAEMSPAAKPRLSYQSELSSDVADQSRAAGFDAMGAALAHELNQPLAALTIYLQSLERLTRKSPDPPMVELIEKALREAGRAGDIVKRMRRFTSRSEPDRNVVNLNAISDESIDVVQAVDSKKGVRISRDFQPDMPLIMCDGVQIRQVMVNLLANAVEAGGSDTGLVITVRTHMHDGQACFTVTDNGPGVDPRFAGRLFKAFETSKPQGLGLGLAISRMIAQNHGGDLFFESVEGRGAKFGLRLPVR
jgi:two-component system, LuxR family, sensor kinase FixL